MAVINPGVIANLGVEVIKGASLEKETITPSKLSAAMQKHLPLEVGRSEPMVLGKVTITAPAVTTGGPIILSIEGASAAAGVLTIASRTPGTSFAVECLLTTSTSRVNYAIYSE